MQRIGVFVCHCGTNIAGTVDVKAVAGAAAAPTPTPRDQLPKTLPPGDPPAPKKKSGCGCTTEGGEGAGLALVGGLGVAALVTRRRRR